MAKKSKPTVHDPERITLTLRGSQAEIMAEAVRRQPTVGVVLDRLQRDLEHYPKREIRQYEAAILFTLAAQYNHAGALIFEIGTCWGWSAAVMSEAAPLARIVTCTPNPNHFKIASRNLVAYPNIEVKGERSVDLLADPALDNLSLVFVDGDHQHVRDDLPWFNRLAAGGLMFHHDYSPPWSSPRPCRWVWDTLNEFTAKVHLPDVLIVDENEEGMAGWYRQSGEVWNG